MNNQRNQAEEYDAREYITNKEHYMYAITKSQLQHHVQETLQHHVQEVLQHHVQETLQHHVQEVLQHHVQETLQHHMQETLQHHMHIIYFMKTHNTWGDCKARLTCVTVIGISINTLWANQATLNFPFTWGIYDKHTVGVFLAILHITQKWCGRESIVAVLNSGLRCKQVSLLLYISSHNYCWKKKYMYIDTITLHMIYLYNAWNSCILCIAIHILQLFGYTDGIKCRRTRVWSSCSVICVFIRDTGSIRKELKLVVFCPFYLSSSRIWVRERRSKDYTDSVHWVSPNPSSNSMCRRNTYTTAIYFQVMKLSIKVSS